MVNHIFFEIHHIFKWFLKDKGWPSHFNVITCHIASHYFIFYVLRSDVWSLVEELEIY